MPIVTATEVTVLSGISASAVTIAESGLIPIIQDRICLMANNWFCTNLHVQGSVVFDASARTIFADGFDFEANNFLAGDDIYIYGSYRNDGFQTVSGVLTETLTLATGSSVVNELSGRSVLISVVKWPSPLKYIAAQMVKYDHEVRPKMAANVKSRSLGPWSETYSNDTDEYGYPKSITEGIANYRVILLI